MVEPQGLVAVLGNHHQPCGLCGTRTHAMSPRGSEPLKAMDDPTSGQLRRVPNSITVSYNVSYCNLSYIIIFLSLLADARLG